ncbi:MAG TPA: glutaredoxin domain-containing protein [Anaerolineaceae bacterium]|nr:glutaredoxin domain-containing protein [Anaerolineaceae bacterium]
MDEEKVKKVIMYGTSWCGMTRRARVTLDVEKVDYEYIDIDQDEKAAQYVMSVAKGYRSVPTIVFPDGDILVEPSSYDLREKLKRL